MSTQALVEDKISQVQKYVHILHAYQEHSQTAIEQDVTLRGAVERYLYLLAQTTIDLAEVTAAYKKMRKPATMSETFDILSEGGVITETLRENMIRLTGFRNVLAHDYTKIDYGIVYDVLTNRLVDVEEFVQAVDASL